MVEEIAIFYSDSIAKVRTHFEIINKSDTILFYYKKSYFICKILFISHITKLSCFIAEVVVFFSVSINKNILTKIYDTIYELFVLGGSRNSFVELSALDLFLANVCEGGGYQTLISLGRGKATS